MTIDLEKALKAFIGATGATEAEALTFLENNGYSVVGAVSAYRASLKAPEKASKTLSKPSKPVEAIPVAKKERASQKRSQAAIITPVKPPVIPPEIDEDEEEEDSFISVDAAHLAKGDFICSISGYSAPANMRSQISDVVNKGSQTIIQLVNGNQFPLVCSESVVVIRGLDFIPAPTSDLSNSVAQLQDKFHSKPVKRR